MKTLKNVRFFKMFEFFKYVNTCQSSCEQFFDLIDVTVFSLIVLLCFCYV